MCVCMCAQSTDLTLAGHERSSIDNHRLQHKISRILFFSVSNCMLHPSVLLGQTMHVHQISVSLCETTVPAFLLFFFQFHECANYAKLVLQLTARVQRPHRMDLVVACRFLVSHIKSFKLYTNFMESCARVIASRIQIHIYIVVLATFKFFPIPMNKKYECKSSSKNL